MKDNYSFFGEGLREQSVPSKTEVVVVEMSALKDIKQVSLFDLCIPSVQQLFTILLTQT